ncbi:hypothetical protein ACPXCX_52705, partial [Streptomyces sp. DT225]
ATTLLVPFQGEQPMHADRVCLPVLVCAVFALAAPRTRQWRLTRYGAVVYAVGVVLTFFVASPIGTNVERLLGLVAVPVLCAAILDTARAGARARTKFLAAALVITGFWLVNKTVADLRVATPVPAWA